MQQNYDKAYLSNHYKPTETKAETALAFISTVALMVVLSVLFVMLKK